MANEKSDNISNVPCLCSQRWVLAYVGFFGICVMYMLRVNFSVAILCMVRQANSTSTNNNSLVYNSTMTGDDDCEEDMGEGFDNNRAEFDWDKSTTATMLSAYFYGYIVMQIPGGLLADRYGGKKVMTANILISSVCTLLLPVCARASLESVYVLRILLGFASGVSFPAMHSMWGRWAPPLERSKLMALCYSGAMVGNIMTFPLSGYLCSEGFDNGWGSIFYTTGALGLIWTALWWIITADSPQQHPRISNNEKYHIETLIGESGHRRRLSVPWKDMFKSPALWSCLVAHVCYNWTNYTLLTSMPTFLKEALKFDLKKNGLLSALPYFCQAVSGITMGQVADLLRSRKILSTTSTRKLFQVSSFIGAAACLIGTGYISCDNRYIAVLTLSLAVTFGGFSRVGYVVNHVDFAPRYAGVLLGITNTVATVPGMLAPIVAGELTPNKTAEEWRRVFFVCAGFSAFGAIIFGIFARGEEEPWARHGGVVKEFEMSDEVNFRRSES